MTGSEAAQRALSDGVDPGEAALCVGSPMTGKLSFLEAFLGERLSVGNVVVLLETDPGSFDLDAMVEGLEIEPRLAVTTLTGAADRSEGVQRWSTVSSPGDLTGLGISLQEPLQTFADRPADIGLWVVLDSINTIDAYAESERLFQFVHSLVTRIGEVDGEGLFTLHENAIDREVAATLGSLFDQRVEFETTGDEVRRLRLVSPDDTGPWYEIAPAPSARARSQESTVELESVPDSLETALDHLLSAGQTLTVYDAEPDDIAALEPFFEQYGASVETARSEPDTGLEPFALLSRERDVLAVSSVSELRTMVDLDRSGDGAPSFDVVPDVLEHLDQSVFSTRHATRQRLVRASSEFELAALRDRTGVLRAGFQRLSRFAVDEATVDLYRQIVDAGVEVHVYGVPDEEVSLDGVVVHPVEASEVAESWFVVYDGGGDPMRSGALLCRERPDGRFDGAWTNDAEFAAGLDRYLADSYPASAPPS